MMHCFVALGILVCDTVQLSNEVYGEMACGVSTSRAERQHNILTVAPSHPGSAFETSDGLEFEGSRERRLPPESIHRK